MHGEGERLLPEKLMTTPTESAVEAPEDSPIPETEYPEEMARMAPLWQKYNFRGRVPFNGAADRLIRNCKNYVNAVLNDGLTGATGSDGYRRTQHNQVAIMLVGKERSGLSDQAALRISDFAFELILGIGQTMYKAESDVIKARMEKDVEKKPLRQERPYLRKADAERIRGTEYRYNKEGD